MGRRYPLSDYGEAAIPEGNNQAPKLNRLFSGLICTALQSGIRAIIWTAGKPLNCLKHYASKLWELQGMGTLLFTPANESYREYLCLFIDPLHERYGGEAQPVNCRRQGIRCRIRKR